MTLESHFMWMALLASLLAATLGGWLIVTGHVDAAREED